MKYNYEELGAILCNRRKDLNISMRGLAYEVGVSHTEIYNIENGFVIKPNMVTIIKICEALGINPLRVLYVSNFFTQEMVEDFVGKKIKSIQKLGKGKYKIEAKNIAEIIKILDELFAEIGSLNSKSELKNKCKNCDFYCSICDERTCDE